jgi:hypothetical protein
MKTQIQIIKGYAVLLKGKNDHQFLAHGPRGLPWFSTRFPDARAYKNDLGQHGLSARVIKTTVTFKSEIA